MNNKSGKHKIMFASERIIKFIEVEDIICCEANGSYTKILLSGGEEFLTTKGLKEIEKKLKPHAAFFRINKSKLINMDSIKEIHKNNTMTIILKNGMPFKIAYRRISQFNQIIKQRF